MCKFSTEWSACHGVYLLFHATAGGDREWPQQVRRVATWLIDWLIFWLINWSYLCQTQTIWAPAVYWQVGLMSSQTIVSRIIIIIIIIIMKKLKRMERLMFRAVVQLKTIVQQNRIETK